MTNILTVSMVLLVMMTMSVSCSNDRQIDTEGLILDELTTEVTDTNCFYYGYNTSKLFPGICVVSTDGKLSNQIKYSVRNDGTSIESIPCFGIDDLIEEEYLKIIDVKTQTPLKYRGSKSKDERAYCNIKPNDTYEVVFKIEHAGWDIDLNREYELEFILELEFETSKQKFWNNETRTKSFRIDIVE